ncbi:cytochrome P450 CYP736A12-like [Cucurbita pepo subsp. pepo]|uniref:cytochrome P450 CYP736A12-like n=1 Tax=Cucurbita pepo subsp. pepo TaxID=3664 RepID=UPI000C9D295D|nr:cytochrome P450 CYP736A12-like [Cucurbita pepo subsp. pepo]
MALILATMILISLLTYLIQGWVFKSNTFGNKLPPGPKGFPIIGSLHLLSKLIHRDLHHLSQRYGPIMYMQLGRVHAIVVSSPRAAELFLKTHDLDFPSRPLTKTSNQISYGRKGIAFSQYDSHWRNMRKMCTLELFSFLKINSFSSMRKQEVRLLVDDLQEAAENRVAVDLSSKISCLIVDIMCLMVVGRKYRDKELDAKGFKAVIQEATRLAAAPNLGDFFPFIARLDLQGLCRRAKSVGDVFDGFLEKIVEEHVVSKNDKNKDFVDVMLDLMGSRENDYQIDCSTIKAMILDLLIAAVDSSTTIINWALPELIKHPHIMKKMQEELEKVVGLNRMVEESDLNNLKYLEMVIKETFRMHPPIPLIPRESIQDCMVNGYHIPNKSRLVINAWAIGRDARTWLDPDEFIPERFVDEQVDMKGKDFKLIPFGYGRRGCPGTQLALTTVRLVVAQLVHCFDWELPNGMMQAELDMTEEFGLTCPRAQNLVLIPRYRLNNANLN